MYTKMFYPAVLLFVLNLLDAILTIIWVRNGIAPEANKLMEALLEVGDLPFIAVKIIIGLIASIVLWRWERFRIARYGLMLVLTIYCFVLLIHFLIGVIAFSR